MSQNVAASRQHSLNAGIDRFVVWVCRHWLALFIVVYGAFVLLPWLAPVLLNAGLTGPGRAVHAVYSAFCHQFPERSFFFYGPQTMYSIPQIEQAWPYYEDIARWRQFIGTPEMGWKLAWSDRMVSMYTSVWVGALLFALVRRRLRPPRIGVYIALALPMVIDGLTHTINDALRLDFRQTNEWLAVLTNHAFAPTFYAGDAFGSFNSWLRLVTGVVFGLATVWIFFPLLERAFREVLQDWQRNRAAVGRHQEPS